MPTLERISGTKRLGYVLQCRSFCSTFVRPEAERIGCTEERRAKCRQIMELNLGYALQPEIIERADTAEEAVSQPFRPIS